MDGECSVSFKVLVIPEDPTNNGYILQPFCKRLLEAAGKPNAIITVLPEPKVQGYSDAKSKLQEEIPGRWAHMDLFLFIPDADGKEDARRDEFISLERKLQSQERPVHLFCCAAVQELETWILAGHPDKLKAEKWDWKEVREEISVKERYFNAFLEKHGNISFPGGGRKQLAIEALVNFSGIKRKCPEIQILEDRIRTHLSTVA
jgi:hypothetical protein